MMAAQGYRWISVSAYACGQSKDHFQQDVELSEKKSSITKHREIMDKTQVLFPVCSRACKTIEQFLCDQNEKETENLEEVCKAERWKIPFGGRRNFQSL